MNMRQLRCLHGYDSASQCDQCKQQGNEYEVDHLARLLREANNTIDQYRADKVKPIPMLLYCPHCNARHIDINKFATHPHHTHACQSCGMVWRPAVVHTVGVQFLPGFKDDEVEVLGCTCVPRGPHCPACREAHR